MNASQKHTVMHALVIAAERFDDHEGEFTKLAALLRSGANHAMFAPGEAGARAAERMADQFRRQAKDARTVRDELEAEDESDDDGE